jgi:Ricin-type beta-trefoil lectin domain
VADRWPAAADATPSYGGTPGTGVEQPVGPITETQTGKCADDRGAGTSNGTAIQIYICNGTGAQQWDQNSAGELVNPQSGLCLTDSSNRTANSTQLEIAACTGAAGQLRTLPSA